MFVFLLGSKFMRIRYNVRVQLGRECITMRVLNRQEVFSFLVLKKFRFLSPSVFPEVKFTSGDIISTDLKVLNVRRYTERIQDEKEPWSETGETLWEAGWLPRLTTVRH